MAATVQIAYVVDSDGAVKAAAKVDKALQGNAKAAEKASEATENLNEANGKAADKIDATGKVAVKLRGILGTLHPALGEAAGLVDDLADASDGAKLAGEGLGVSLGAVGTAAGVAALAAAALGTGYLALTNHQEAAAEEAGRVASALEAAEARSLATAEAVQALSAAMTSFRASGQKLQQQIADINSGTEQLVILQREASEAVQEAARPQLRAYAESAAALDIQLSRQQALVDGMAKTDAAYAEELAALQSLEVARGSAIQRLEELKGEVEDQKQNARDVAEYNYELAESERVLASRTTASTTATREKTAALSEEERMLAELNAEIDAANVARSDQRMAEQEAMFAAVDAELEAEEAKYEQIKEYQAEYDAMVQESAEAEQRAHQETRDAVIALASDVASALGEAAEAQGKQGAKAAEKAFRFQQGLAITEALVQGALAGITALGPPPTGYGPTPAGFAAAGTAAGATIGAVAKIAAQEPPTYHIGGVPSASVLGGTEGSATVRAGEMVVDRSTTADIGGPAGLRAMMGGGGGTVIRIGRREVREMVRTDLRSGGLIAQVGREAARSSTPPGRSTRRPLA